MALSFQCPHCRKEHRGPEALAGRAVACTECSKIFTVPGGRGTTVAAGGSGNRRGGTVYGAAAAELAQDAAAGEFKTDPTPNEVDAALAGVSGSGRVCPHCGQKVPPASGARICVACGGDLYASGRTLSSSHLTSESAAVGQSSLVAGCIWGSCATVTLIFSLAFHLGNASAVVALVLGALTLGLGGIAVRLLFRLGEMIWAILAVGLMLGGLVMAGLSVIRMV